MTRLAAPSGADGLLLQQRIRSGLWLLLASGLLFLLTNLVYPPARAGAVILVLALQVAVVSAALIAGPHVVGRRLAISLALVVIAVVSFTAAGAAILSNNLTANPLLFVLLAMGSAALLPWGVEPQLAAVGIAAGALFWNLHAVSGSLTAFSPLVTGTVFLALATSVYVAWELDHSRARTAREAAERRAAEEALRLSQERYATAARAGGVGVLDWNLVSDELYLDPVLKDLLGYQDNDLPNRISEWIRCGHRGDRDLVLQSVNAHLQGKTPRYEYEHRLICKDGTVKWFLARGQALRNQQGDPVRLLGAETDITALKELEQVQRQEGKVSAALLRTAQETMAAFDTPFLLERLCGVVVDVLQSDRSHTWLWEARDDAYAAVAGAGDPPDQREFIRAVRLPAYVLAPLIDQLQRTEVADLSAASLQLFLPPSLVQRLGSTRALFMALRQGPRVIGIQSAEYAKRPEDFSATEQRIARGIAHIASLGIRHARLLEELEHANRLKSEFVATMSHELRTPLHAIIGYNDLVIDGDFGPLGDEQREALLHVRRSARHLRDIVDGILDLSRLERGQLPLREEEVRLTELIARIVEETRSAFDKPAVRLAWDVPADLPAVRTDEGKLAVVLKNVIANAFKFTAEGNVTVAVRCDHRTVRFRITDTGTGIAPEALPVIFEPFRQGEPYLTRRHDGLGLGLYVARRLLDALGGAIEVETEVGRGSAFTITIPRHPGPSTDSAISGLPQGPSEGDQVTRASR